MDLEEAPDSEGSEKSELFSQKEEEEFDEGEEEEDEEHKEEEEEEEKGKEKVKMGLLNPLLQPILTGDVDSLQKIFEDPENPLYDQTEHLLLEEDIVGRNLLYAACMAGQSEVIRVLAKYGMNLNDNTARGYTLLHCAAAWGRLETLKVLVLELDVDIEAPNFRKELARDVAARYSQTECVEFLDWAAARLALRKYIMKVSTTLAELEKGPGRLFKEDKNTILNACRLRSDWLEAHLEASISEIFEQKQQLEDIVTPIFLKISTPRQVRSAKSVA
ncbi:ankyrin repeat domain-containing protein 45 [Pipistrellus kuhlii]|uniref:ankyrin repeat domain-containing protein 45 n=1 Tax=Pipistrellus kuhlii TaxID=59472 RepID=UPI00174EDCFD|nr:ankyrin repeat domain-containing protein 45 [Pipistrellus kuhlii]